jgi:hypothetical protein
MIRITQLLRRKPGSTLESFQQHFQDVHAALVASSIGSVPILRYVQAPTISNAGREEGTPPNPDASLERGVMLAPYDGVAEFWFATREDLEQAFEPGSGFNAALIASEQQFIDAGKSLLWFAYEYPQVNPAPEDIVAETESDILKFYYPVASLPGADFKTSQRYWRTCHGPVIRAQAPVMEALRYIQVHRFEDALADNLAAARGAATPHFMGIAELWFDASRFSADDARIDAQRIAIADEARFIDFSRSCMWWAKEKVVIDNSLFELMRADLPVSP